MSSLNKLPLAGIDVHEDVSCSTHMPILLHLLHTGVISRSVEYGSGLYSTKALLSYSETHSIESDNKWYEHLKSYFKSETWHYYYIKEWEQTKEKLFDIKDIDLIFVDGDQNWRAEFTNLSFQLANTIIVHDSQKSWRKKIVVPANFMTIDFKQFPVKYENWDNDDSDYRPWTTVYTSDDFVKEIYVNEIHTNEHEIYGLYSFPYLYDAVPKKP